MTTTAPVRRQREGRDDRRRGFARLRSAYFAQAADSAARYGVNFDEVVQHLWHARRHHPRLLLRSVRYVDDLVHAIACHNDAGLAWADLFERYERGLIRRCRAASSEVDAVLIVRRLLADLRRSGESSLAAISQRLNDRSIAVPASLHTYTGAKPLRLWLHERLEPILTRQALGRMRPRRPAVRATPLRLSHG
jgi:hypothetical protein